MLREPARAGRGDAGVTLVLFALLITALLFVVAIVIDFGNVRNTRQDAKRIGDVAVSAGLASLAPDGKPRPWAAACEALKYLEANRPDLTFTVSYWNGNGPDGGVGPVGSPCPHTIDLEEGDVCVPGDESTWAWIRAVAPGLAVDIRSGYETGPGSGFAEDGTIYAGDDSQYQGCDQIAVITDSTDGAFFGGIAGRTSYETASRSVGRVEIGDEGDVAVALVLLETEDCLALDFRGGGSGGSVTVRGTDDRPGIIHSDSSGSGSGCNVRPVIRGSSSGFPRVRALAAPTDSAEHGIVSTYHRFNGGTNDAVWTGTRSSSDVWLCDPDSTIIPPPAPASSTCDTGPTGGSQVSREPADERYLAEVTNLRAEANAVFSWVATDSPPEGWTRLTSIPGMQCNMGGTAGTHTVRSEDVPSGNLYVDCPGGNPPSTRFQVGNGWTWTVESGINNVVFQGGIASSGTVDIRNARRILVYNAAASNTAVSSNENLWINSGGHAGADACSLRQAANRSETTELVIRRGGIQTGGSGSFRLCSTFVHLMGSDAGNAPVDVNGSGYPHPYDNLDNDGTIDVGGSGNVEWTAPNTESGTPSAGTYPFEDLALWTETQRPNLIGGTGAMRLSGIYFLPNTGPSDGPGGFQIRGGSSGDIDFDAQLWARKLQHNGGAALMMRADPADSIPLPFLRASGLVR